MKKNLKSLDCKNKANTSNKKNLRLDRREGGQSQKEPIFQNKKLRSVSKQNSEMESFIFNSGLSKFQNRHNCNQQKYNFQPLLNKNSLLLKKINIVKKRKSRDSHSFTPKLNWKSVQIMTNQYNEKPYYERLYDDYKNQVIRRE